MTVRCSIRGRLPASFPQGEGGEDADGYVPQGRHARLLRRTGRLAERALGIRPRLRVGADAIRVGLGGDRRRDGGLLRFDPRVAAPGLHQLLLAAGELDLIREFVLADRRLAFDGHRAAREGRLVGILLYRLPRRGLQGALDVGLGAQQREAHPDDLDAEIGQPRVVGEHRGRGPAELGEIGAECLIQRARLQQVHDRGGRRTVQRRRDGLERLLAPPAGAQVDREVDAPGGEVGVDDPVGGRGGRRELLQVGCAQRHHDGELAIVERHFADRCVQRPEPECLAGTVVPPHAAAGVGHVHRGRRAQVTDEGAGGDGGHEILFPLLVSL